MALRLEMIRLANAGERSLESSLIINFEICSTESLIFGQQGEYPLNINTPSIHDTRDTAAQVNRNDLEAVGNN